MTATAKGNQVQAHTAADNGDQSDAVPHALPDDGPDRDCDAGDIGWSSSQGPIPRRLSPATSPSGWRLR